MSHISLIYNPMAGRLRRRPELVRRAAEWLAPMGEVRPLPTTGPETAGQLAAEAAANGATTIVAFGGDGTVNEIANGLVGTPTTLGIIPGGTANVLCVEMGLGTNPEKGARRLVEECEPVRIAVGRMKRPDGFSRYFVAMAGIGLDAMVVERVHQPFKRLAGKAAYWIAGFAMAVVPLPQFHFESGGEKSRRSFLLASRVRNYGGDLEIARRVSLTDPVFETVAFHGDFSIRYIPYLAGVLTGTVAKFPGVRVGPATALQCGPLNGERVPVQLDGELAGYLPAEFEVVPDALTLLIPRKYLQKAKEQPWITSPTH